MSKWNRVTIVIGLLGVILTGESCKVRSDVARPQADSNALATPVSQLPSASIGFRIFQSKDYHSFNAIFRMRRVDEKTMHLDIVYLNDQWKTKPTTEASPDYGVLLKIEPRSPNVYQGEKDDMRFELQINPGSHAVTRFTIVAPTPEGQKVSFAGQVYPFDDQLAKKIFPPAVSSPQGG